MRAATTVDVTRVVNVRRAADQSIPEAIYIGRPSLWGNPFVIDRDGDRKTVIDRYMRWIMLAPQKKLRERARRDLRGRYLACYCKPAPCHGDILAWIADSGSDRELRRTIHRRTGLML